MKIHPLKKWLLNNNCSVAKFAGMTDYTEDFLYKVMARKRNLSTPACKRISEITGIPKQTLMFGEPGTMRKKVRT